MTNSAFNEIAAAAARLFLTQGYRGVGLRAIANDLGIQAASLYHHCPGGKAELYVRALQWFLKGYTERLLAARGRATFPESLLRMAVFILGENHVDLRRIIMDDLPHLPDEHQTTINECLHDVLLRPFVEEFDAAKQCGKVRKRLDSPMAASCVLAIANSLGGFHLPNGEPPSAESLNSAEQLVRSGVKLLLDGTA